MVGDFGLIINAIGALLLAISFAEYSGESVRGTTGAEYHPAFMNHYGAMLGLSLLILGFSLQFLERQNKNKTQVPLKDLLIVVLVAEVIFFLSLTFSGTILFR